MGYPAAEPGVEALRRLAAAGAVDIERGLRDAEFDLITARYGFTFADDHRAFLTGGLPSGPGWPDWRSPEARTLRDQLSSPVEGVLFDVEHSGFWHHEWGTRPAKVSEALEVAGARLVRAPQLVPLRGNRYLPAGGGSSGHPVLSVFRSRVDIAGADLVDWVALEFDGSDGADKSAPITVEFWAQLADQRA